jgi:hypothetical protein
MICPKIDPVRCPILAQAEYSVIVHQSIQNILLGDQDDHILQ